MFNIQHDELFTDCDDSNSNFLRRRRQITSVWENFIKIKYAIFKCILQIAWEKILNNFLDQDFDSWTSLLHSLSAQITEVFI